MTYSPEAVATIKAAICEKIADGQSLRTICAAEDMPVTSTVCLWLSQDTAFSQQYARAREAQADALFDEILEIADDGSNDWMERQNFEGDAVGWHLNGEAQARSRLRIDARKWMAGKLQPKKYGEKLAVDSNVVLSADETITGLLQRVAAQGGRLITGPDE